MKLCVTSISCMWGYVCTYLPLHYTYTHITYVYTYIFISHVGVIATRKVGLVHSAVMISSCAHLTDDICFSSQVPSATSPLTPLQTFSAPQYIRTLIVHPWVTPALFRLMTIPKEMGWLGHGKRWEFRSPRYMKYASIFIYLIPEAFRQVCKFSQNENYWTNIVGPTIIVYTKLNPYCSTVPYCPAYCTCTYQGLINSYSR